VSKFVTHIFMATLIVRQINFVIDLWPVTIYIRTHVQIHKRTAHAHAHTQMEARTRRRTHAHIHYTYAQVPTLLEPCVWKGKKYKIRFASASPGGDGGDYSFLCSVDGHAFM
jgi:hypothetical protein